MIKAWSKIPVVLLSMAAAFLLFALAAYTISYKADIYLWLTQVCSVEWHIAESFYMTARGGYTHFYLLRVVLGYALAIYGFCRVWVRYVWPLRLPVARRVYALLAYVRHELTSDGDSRLALILQTMFSSLLALVALEGLLRLVGFYPTYTESIGHGYISYFDQVSFNRYNTYGAKDTVTLDHKDFRYLYRLNELGQRERPLAIFCDTPLHKIVTLGDSYTEGVGTSYDSSWPQALVRHVSAVSPSFALYNGGQSGDDPFFEYMLYVDQLKKCSPDIVVVSINTSDISDYYYRGGMERFGADGRVRFRHGPWTERLYASSRVFRFISINLLGQKPQMFISDREYARYEQDFVRDTREVLLRLQRSVQPGRLLVVVHPGPTDCAHADNDEIRHSHGVLAAVIQGLDHDGIYTADLYEPIGRTITEANVMQYTYEHDKHYSGKGYQLFADELWREIGRKYPGFFQSSNDTH